MAEGPPTGAEASARRWLWVRSRRVADTTIESQQLEWQQIALRETRRPCDELAAEPPPQGEQPARTD
jgi:hypothetical protein